MCVLDIRCDDVGDAGASVLASVISTAVSLHTLRIALRGNSISDTGAESLASLSFAPSLRTLVLDLTANHIGPHGSQVLAQGLQRAPALQQLELYLSGNPIRDLGAEGLAALGRCERLQSLILALGACQLGPLTGHTLGTLTQGHSLRSLTLYLSWNPFGPQWARDFVPQSGRACSQRLDTLNLCLSGCGLGDQGAMALAKLKAGASLRELTIDISSNNVGDAGAISLATTHRSPSLQCLSLDLAANPDVVFGEKLLRESAKARPRDTVFVDQSGGGWLQE